MVIYELGEPEIWFSAQRMFDSIRADQQKKKTMNIEQQRLKTEAKLKKDKELRAKQKEKQQLFDLIQKTIFWILAIISGAGIVLGLITYSIFAFSESFFKGV